MSISLLAIKPISVTRSSHKQIRKKIYYLKEKKTLFTYGTTDVSEKNMIR
jgi:hypothetical protein